MLTVCFTAKGGQGCSTVAAMLAIRTGAGIVDATGDMPAVLGVPDTAGPGLTDMLIAGSPLYRVAEHLCDHGTVRLVPRGRYDPGDVPDHRWSELAAVLTRDTGWWVLDAGTGPARAIADRANQALLVSRYCYLALRRTVDLAVRPTGVVAIREPGRALDRHDLERTTGVPVVADLPWAPEIARAVDAGLLMGGRGLPAAARQALDRLTGWDRQSHPDSDEGHDR